MKALIKSMIPQQLVPILGKAYWKLTNFSKRVNLSKELGSCSGRKALACKIAYNKYGGYCIPLSSHHRPAAQKILSGDVYEPDTISYILKNCKGGDIVHAGTYFGDFLPALSEGMAQSAKVWAFEPSSENYRCAKITLEINDIANVVLTNAGLGSKKETLPFKTKDANGRALGGGGRIIAENIDGLPGVESVRIVTIDESIPHERAVSIIQLDVEGHEEEALKGAIKTIQRCLPVIMLEMWQRNPLLSGEWFLDNVLGLGYREVGLVHGNRVFACGKTDRAFE